MTFPTPTSPDSTLAVARPTGGLAADASENAKTPLSDRLVNMRLGIFSGLFFALRARHAPTAAHGLRVAMGCSKWAGYRSLGDPDRSLLEVAALLHDIGKIGIPDRVLQKPTPLDGQEQLMMEMHGSVATEMLRGAGATQELMDIVQYSRSPFSVDTDRIPLESRMLCIVDAFDSMTTEQVFRRALSRERAIDELFSNAGTQFDPQLVQEFATLLQQPRADLEAEICERWLNQLVPNPTPGFWESGVPVSCGAIQNLIDTLFHHRLLDSLVDAAIYLDAYGQILHWNRAAERLTGHQSATLIHRAWTAELMGLRNEKGEPLPEDECPVRIMSNTHVQFNARMQIENVDGRCTKVNFSALPVFTGQKEFSGTILVVRDASAQANLEERVQSLHAIASRDPLTKVANRAEMDRRLPIFVQNHLKTCQPGSLIICDIDHFKRINDTYGHQAGDDALVTFAGVLREISREGDLVARYGGEEFVVLCAGCDNPAATSRAEEIRRAVERTPVPSLDGNTMTASFGVTEIQLGDTPATLVSRADRALLTAKSSGRNRVVQLGAGQDPRAEVDVPLHAPQEHRSGWLGWFRNEQESPLVQTQRLASVPHALAVQKLQGFISDHCADVLKIEDTHVTLKIDSSKSESGRRRHERPTVMIMDVSIAPVDYRAPRTNTYQSKTMLEIIIRPVRARDRRSDALLGQAQQLLASFNSYLVTQEITEDMRARIIQAR